MALKKKKVVGSAPKKLLKKKQVTATSENDKKPKSAAVEKWSALVMNRGFVMLPAIIVRGQRRLGLSPTQLVILLNLIDWWIHPDSIPWTSKKLLAQRIGIGERQLQRQIAQMEKIGYLQRVERVTGRGKRPNSYDLSGLVARLKALAPEFAKANAAKHEVEKQGGGVAKKTIF
jgi:hypothetical protein